jgi:transposase
MDQKRPVVDVDINEVKAALERIKAVAEGDDYALVERLVDNYIDLTRLVRERGTSIARLRRLFGLAKSEKTADVVGNNGAGRAPAHPQGGSTDPKPTGRGSGTEAGTPSGPGPTAPGATTGVGDAGSAPVSATDETLKKKSKGHGRLSWLDYPDALRIPVMHPNLHVGQICPLCGRGYVEIGIMRSCDRNPVGVGRDNST